MVSPWRKMRDRLLTVVILCLFACIVYSWHHSNVQSKCSHLKTKRRLLTENPNQSTERNRSGPSEMMQRRGLHIAAVCRDIEAEVTSDSCSFTSDQAGYSQALASTTTSHLQVRHVSGV